MDQRHRFPYSVEKGMQLTILFYYLSQYSAPYILQQSLSLLLLFRGRKNTEAHPVFPLTMNVIITWDQRRNLCWYCLLKETMPTSTVIKWYMVTWVEQMCSTIHTSEHSGTIGGQMSATWWLLCNAIYRPGGMTLTHFFVCLWIT